MMWWLLLVRVLSIRTPPLALLRRERADYSAWVQANPRPQDLLQQAPAVPAAPVPAAAPPALDPAYTAWVAAQLPLIPVLAQPALATGLQQPPIPGLILEFGVFTGTSINLIAQQRPAVPVYGFDSFQGLPGQWRAGFDKGAFDLKGQLPQVAANVQLVPGWFNETLPGFLAQHPEPVSFLHVDCDMYSSTKTIFDLVATRIAPGTVIVFDELVNYPEFRDHELKAFFELLTATGRQFQWLSVPCPIEPNGLSAIQG